MIEGRKKLANKKENAELKQQIEKMKCCINCKYHEKNVQKNIYLCHYSDPVLPPLDMSIVNKYLKACYKWELKE